MSDSDALFLHCMPNLHTDDLDRMLYFYRDFLGFRQVYRYPAEGTPEHVEVTAGDAVVAISSARALEHYGLPPATRGQPFELAIRVNDIDLAMQHLREAGVEVMKEPSVSPNGQQVAYVLDPDGNRVHLYVP